MGKWTEDLGREITLLIKGLSKEKQQTKESEEKKKLPGIREIGLPRLMLMLLAGIVLFILTFPDIFSQTDSQETSIAKKEIQNVKMTEKERDSSDIDTYIENAEMRLKHLLKQVENVGNVEVMITVKATGESIPLKDIPYEKNSSSEESTGIKRSDQGERTEEETVMVEDSDGTRKPYVIKETVPEIEGVVVLAENGGSSEIKKEIMEAVQALFNIKAHKIKVMKMN